MTVLVTAAFAFFLLHRLVSAGPLRAPLVQRFGETTFLKLFGGASLACLSWLTLGYWLASTGQPPSRWATGNISWLIWPLEFLATVMIAAGVLARNPGTAGQLDAISEPDVVRGVLRIARHPFLWGMTIMSIGHMISDPDVATLIYFGTLAALAATGTVSIDQKRRSRLGGEWLQFAAKTSNIPFAAIIQGRQTLHLREIGWRPLYASMGLFALVIIAHVLFGASPTFRAG